MIPLLKLLLITTILSTLASCSTIKIPVSAAPTPAKQTLGYELDTGERVIYGEIDTGTGLPDAPGTGGYEDRAVAK